MSNIDSSVQPRSSFFPNAKLAQAQQAKKMRKAGLTRNDYARKTELDSLTSKDAKVNIGDAIKDFSRIKRTVDAAPEIDNSAKIAKLKAQIQGGTYKIDYDALADKMLEQQF